jgi:hypothetical protein
VAVNGVAVAVVAGGAVFVYASVKGKSVLASVQAIVSGNSPSTAAAANTITAAPITPAGGSPSAGNVANQALGKLMAGAYGWGAGDEWTAFNNIVMAESGWDYQAGSASQQIAGMLSYIKGRYGDPISAWTIYLANGSY